MEILGQPLVLQYLNEGLKRQRISPSLLFVGPDGVGKRLTAIELAKCFCCEENLNGKEFLPRCEKCRSCLQVANNNHADVLVMDRILQATLLREKPESQTVIKIDSVRHITKFLSLKPLEARRRVVIIDEAHKMNTESANSLLKLLEEPPNQAQLVLIATNEHALPPTILSRCAILRFRAVPNKTISDWLENVHAVSESKAMELADRAGGSFEKALSVKDEERQTTDLSEYTVEEFFTLLSSTNWRKEGRKQAESAITNLIESSQKKLEEGDLLQKERIESLLDARRHLDRNVPAKLVLETLFLKLEGIR